MDKVIFTRLELYNLVWEFPVVKIAEHYDISRMSIKKACAQMKIPLPGSKHWGEPNLMRKSIPKLSIEYNQNVRIIIEKRKNQRPLRKIAKPTLLAELVNTIESDPKAPLLVSKFLTNPCYIIQEYQEHWKKNKLNKNTQIYLDEVLQINVSSNNIMRALLFMNALIKLLEYRGHRFKKGKDGTGIILMNKEIEIDIYLREALKRTPAKQNKGNSEYIHTGKLILQIRKDSFKKEWQDGKTSLEDSLVDIVAKLEIIAAEEQ